MRLRPIFGRRAFRSGLIWYWVLARRKAETRRGSGGIRIQRRYADASCFVSRVASTNSPKDPNPSGLDTQTCAASGRELGRRRCTESACMACSFRTEVTRDVAYSGHPYRCCLSECPSMGCAIVCATPLHHFRAIFSSNERSNDADVHPLALDACAQFFTMRSWGSYRGLWLAGSARGSARREHV